MSLEKYYNEGKLDISAMLVDISSDQLEVSIPAVDSAREMNRLLLNSIFAAFKQGGRRSYFIFERLVSFCGLVVKPLISIYNETEMFDVKTYSALALFGLGENNGVSWILQVLADDVKNRPYLGSIGQVLIHSPDRIDGVPEIVLSRLSKLTPVHVDLGKSFKNNVYKDELVLLLSVIEHYEVSLPADLFTVFTGDNIPLEVSSIAKNLS